MNELLEKWEEYRIFCIKRSTDIGYKMSFEEFVQWYKAQEANKPWVPVYGESYWYVNTAGDVCEETWDGAFNDKNRQAFGNIFKSQMQADMAMYRVKAALIEK